MAYQDFLIICDTKALLDRVEEVTDDIKKLTEENAMLQTYLDNMTRNTYVLLIVVSSKTTILIEGHLFLIGLSLLEDEMERGS